MNAFINTLSEAITPKTNSLNASIWDKLFKRYRLSDYFPYETFDDIRNVYRGNDNMYGSVVECLPRIGMGSDTSVTIQELLEKLPDNIHLQIIMMGSCNSEQLINRWEQDHYARANHDEVYGPTMRLAIKNMANFYRSKQFEQVSSSIVTKVKNSRLLFCLKHDDEEVLFKTKSILIDLLASNNFFPNELKPKELKPILWEPWNLNHFIKEDGKDTYKLDIPEYQESMELNRQILAFDTEVKFTDHYLIADKKYWKVLAPQKLSPYAHVSDFGAKLGDYISNVMDSNQFNDAFFVTLNIRPLKKKDSKSVEKNHGIIDSQNWPEYMREFHKRKEESASILDRMANNEVMFAMDLNVCISGDTQEEMEFNASTIQSYWNKGGDHTSIKLAPVDGIHQLAFMASQPLGVSDEYYETTRKFHKLFAEQVAQYLPMEADYKGTNPNIMAFSRRGQYGGLDVFCSDNNYNGYVIATSGSGKSVFLNMLAFVSYCRGDIIFIVDLGNSYKKQCEVLGGQYIEPDPKNPICINPFSEIKNMEDLRDDLDYLGTFVYMLGASKSILKSDEVEKLVRTKLNNIIIELYKDYGQDLEITYIRDKLLTEEDSRFTDFALQLGNYCKGGLYEGFMCGKNEINLESEFIVTELGLVENEEAIRDPLIMIMLYHLGNMLYNETSGKKIQMIFDEFHKFLGKNPKMDDFVEQAYRRARKHGASVIIATQGFDDIASQHSLTKAGATIVNNSSWKFFLKQTATSINMLINSGVFDFTEMEKQIMRSIKTVVPQYSEIFVMTPQENKIPFRLIMDKFFYYLTSTKQEDKLKIKKIMKEYKIDSTAEAIDILVESEKEPKQKTKE